MNKKGLQVALMLVIMAIISIIFFGLIGSPKTDIQMARYFILMAVTAIYFVVNLIVNNTSVKVLNSVYCGFTFLFNITLGFIFSSIKTLLIINACVLLIFALLGIIDGLATNKK